MDSHESAYDCLDNLRAYIQLLEQEAHTRGAFYGDKIAELEAQLAEAREESERLRSRRAEIDDEAFEYAEQLAEARELLEDISLCFTSGNSVPVDRARINVDAINAWLVALAGDDAATATSGNEEQEYKYD